RSRPPDPARRRRPAAAHGADRSPTPYISPARGAQKSRVSCVLSGRKWLYITRPFSHLDCRRESGGIIESDCPAVHKALRAHAGGTCGGGDPAHLFHGWMNNQPRRPRGGWFQSADVGEDAVQLIQAVVAHDEATLAAGRVLDRYLRAQLIGKLLLQPIHI